MISHKHKCIFIHIPKTAGTSINAFFHPGIVFKTIPPDYERLFGWCSKRQIHLQHATSKQLLELELVSEEVWNEYFKFTFVRNPWDRAYSDYIWIQKFSGVKGSFKNYIHKTNEFEAILNDTTNHHYLGDHLLSQTDFFDIKGYYEMDFIGRFENFNEDISQVINKLRINSLFTNHENKGNRLSKYSDFYTGTMKKWVDKKFKNDIELLDYQFDNNRTGLKKLKKFL